MGEGWGDDELLTTFALVDMVSRLQEETAREGGTVAESLEAMLDASSRGPPDATPAERATGVVERFAPKRGFGIIMSEGDSERYFAHWTQICSTDAWPVLTPGARVEFTPMLEGSKRVAKEITGIGGEEIVSLEDVEKQIRVLSDFYVHGTVLFFNRAGYGFIRIDRDADYIDKVPVGASVYVSRQELDVAEGSACALEKGMRVRFRLQKPEGEPATAAEVTSVDGSPIVCATGGVVPATRTPPIPRVVPARRGVPVGHLARFSVHRPPSALPVRKTILKESATSAARGGASSVLCPRQPIEIPIRSEAPSEAELADAQLRALVWQWQSQPSGPEQQAPRLGSSWADPAQLAPSDGPMQPTLADFASLLEEPAAAALQELSQGSGQSAFSAQLMAAVASLAGGSVGVGQVYRQQTRRAAADLSGTVRKDRPPCRFFHEGRCARGAECNFLHDPGVPYVPSEDPKRRPVCRFFAQGRCAKGQTCTFLHDLSNPEEVAAALAPRDKDMQQRLQQPTVQQQEQQHCVQFLQGLNEQQLHILRQLMDGQLQQTAQQHQPEPSLGPLY